MTHLLEALTILDPIKWKVNRGQLDSIGASKTPKFHVANLGCLLFFKTNSSWRIIPVSKELITMDPPSCFFGKERRWLLYHGIHGMRGWLAVFFATPHRLRSVPKILDPVVGKSCMERLKSIDATG